MSATDSATPVVSVCMITYNHERFIAQAIESVLMQETNFPVELVIGEDCSTDGTRAIVQEYATRNPDKIKALLHPHNLGPAHSPGKHNLVAVLKACTGKYVALLEGDDYWTDPRKLQKQVAFLEAHPECSMCFHDVLVVYDEPQKASHRHCAPDQQEISTLKDLLLKNFIPTPSVMYRWGLFGDLPGWFYELSVGDWPLHILHAQFGSIGYINEVMAVYRAHSSGIWSWRDSVTKIEQMFPLYGHLYNHLDEAHRPSVRMAASTAIAAGAAAKYEAGRTDGIKASLDFVESLLAAGALAGYADRAFKRMTWAKSYEALGFTAFRRQDMNLSRYCFTHALALNPGFIKNKGILSLWFEASFGKTASKVRRRITQHLLRAKK